MGRQTAKSQSSQGQDLCLRACGDSGQLGLPFLYLMCMHSVHTPLLQLHFFPKCGSGRAIKNASMRSSAVLTQSFAHEAE